MKILIAGGTGFIGKRLTDDLRADGHDVIVLSRRAGSDAVRWNPAREEIELDKLEGLDAVVNLAGESVAERWNPSKKERIYDSRIKGTNFLVSAISKLEKRPKAFVCASAIGYYGARADEALTEQSVAGDNFLADVCKKWEESAQAATALGCRWVSLRFGIVLGTAGGALTKMLPPFQMGLGGRLGSGEQHMSWIAVDDAVRAIEFVIENDKVSGPVNVVAPNPVTNNEFTEVLGRVLHKPTVFPVPKAMVYLAFGNEMPDQVLLASNRVTPDKLLSNGFEFQYPRLEPALRHILKQSV